MKYIKKILVFICVALTMTYLYSGCDDIEKKNDSAIKETQENETVDLEQTQIKIIQPQGTTLETRFATPEGYTRLVAQEDSLAAFLRGYELKEDGAPVLLYDGDKKGNQKAQAAVFTMPLVEGDLQQCADSVMRIWAEYFWSTGQYEKIAFHFTNGFLCEYSKWMNGYRVVVDGNDVYWSQSASYDDSYETFEKYLRMVFTYAGTLSLDSYESETIALSDMEVGDVFLKGGSPGHVVMVVDICANEAGEKAFLLAQGYMPAQEFHVIMNPAHREDPWYYENEIQFPLATAEYGFSDEGMVKRLTYR